MLDKLKKNYFILIITFLFIYFFFNLLDGERGLISYIEKKDIYEPILALETVKKHAVNYLLGRKNQLEKLSTTIDQNILLVDINGFRIRVSCDLNLEISIGDYCDINYLKGKEFII